MDDAITAAEANRSFSHLLREVRGGASYVVTTHGRPVARIIPCNPSDSERAKARVTLLQRLRTQTATDIGPWKRDDLYQR
jgi:prevent-host-death family protein